MKRWRRSDITDRCVCLAVVESTRLADAVLRCMFPGCPEKVLYAAMERAYDRGLIEYGVSMRAGWLTEAGEEFVKGG